MGGAPSLGVTWTGQPGLAYTTTGFLVDLNPLLLLSTLEADGDRRLVKCSCCIRAMYKCSSNSWWPSPACVSIVLDVARENMISHRCLL